MLQCTNTTLKHYYLQITIIKIASYQNNQNNQNQQSRIKQKQQIRPQKKAESDFLCFFQSTMHGA